MKKHIKILILLLVCCLCLALLVACTSGKKEDPCANGHKYNKEGVCENCNKTCCELESKHNYVNGVCTYCESEYEFEDFVASCKLDLSAASRTMKEVTTVKMFVDGDTTHFNVSESTSHPEGVLKARYLAVNTPESTGQIEPYGKKASNYTHAKLESAVSIIVESDTDDGIWNTDSYGRTLVWVWYKPAADADYRNLNLELLQEGYGVGSNPRQNRYGESCVAALNQALQAKLIVYSKLDDPDFYYGDAQEIDLKQLRTHPETYDGVQVAFEGVVTKYHNGSSYIEQYCEEDGIYYGISVYYNGSDSYILQALSVGSRVRVVGKASSFNGTWQVSSIKYNPIRPNDPNNIILLEEGCEIKDQEITIEQFKSQKNVTVYDPDQEMEVTKNFEMSALILDTAIKMTNLTVDSVYTTLSGTSKGAISLYCEDEDGNEITVRTEKLYKDDGKGGFTLVTEDEYLGKVITVYGIVDYYGLNGHSEYQVRVVSASDIIIVG